MLSSREDEKLHVKLASEGLENLGSVFLPNKYSDHCEIEASVKLIAISNFHLNCLGNDGDAGQVLISDSCGSLEFIAKTDYEITVRLDISQWKAKTIVHILE